MTHPPTFKGVNTQHMINADMVTTYVLKMEYLFKINIFGLKMMVKGGLEFFFFLKFLHAQSLFRKIFSTS